MKTRHVIVAALLCFLPAASAHAQAREGVMADLLADVGQVEKKLVALARAMPESTYGWRPGEGVRSTGETLLHVAADNYFIPALMGVTIPTGIPIKRDDFQTTVAFEKQKLTRDQVVAELEKSFKHLRDAMTATAEASLAEPLEFFGQKSTRRALWITATTHLHEHLGQLIAYARSNKVTPPWSK